MELTPDQLKAMAPYLPTVKVPLVLPLINGALDKYGIDTPMRTAHFMAQVIHESGSFQFATELADGTAYEYRADLGNTQKGDGPLFKGRGYIQLTGRANYQTYGKAIGQDLIADPDLVATAYPADVAGWFWQTHSLNALADVDALTSITKVINGGNNGLADRLHYLGLCKEALGVPVSTAV